jgi:glycosyltransferase involved in cell wall biosynthesis
MSVFDGPVVLIPSSDTQFAFNYANGYLCNGFTPILGEVNFYLGALKPEIVHLLWPEYLVKQKPTRERLDQLHERLEQFSTSSKIVASVQNLYPHGHFRDPVYRELYEMVYQKADVIHHFSNTSRRLVCEEFPSIVKRKHVVRVGFNYEYALPSLPPDRTVHRSALGIGGDEIVYLVVGAYREWPEVMVLLEAFKNASVPRKKLVFAGRLPEMHRHRLQRKLTSMRLKRFFGRDDVIDRRGFASDSEFANLFHAADVVVVVRRQNLSSGIVCYGMTAGRYVIAPAVGAIPEYLEGTRNAMFDPESPASLSAAIELAANVDREAIGEVNRKIALEWNWPNIIDTCVRGLAEDEAGCSTAKKRVLEKP